jgi:hypothetical protein
MTIHCWAKPRTQHGVTMWRLLGLLGFGLLLVGCGGGGGDDGGDNATPQPPGTMPEVPSLDPRVFPPSSAPFGKGYGEWSAEWWQWMFSIPVSANPLLDETGEKCVTAQRGAVWFLAGIANESAGSHARLLHTRMDGAFRPRLTCRIRQRRSHPPLTVEALRDRAKSLVDAATELLVELDGIPIRNLDLFRFTSSMFSFTLPEDNEFLMVTNRTGAPGTYFPGVADGFYMMLRRLPVGKHTLHIRGRISDIGLQQDVMYQLTVEPLVLPEEL